MVQEETLNSNTSATIVCGHTIGRYAFIGAGAVVTMGVPDCALVLGSPAKVMGWVCEGGYQLSFQSNIASCRECGKQYKESDEGLSCIQDESLVQEAVGESMTNKR